jgi:S-DNA-T family DNA segregation ATPase FtsK/SpoIIIE
MTTWRLRLKPPFGAASEILLSADDATTFVDTTRALDAIGVNTGHLSVNGSVVDSKQTLARFGLVHGDTIGSSTGVAPKPARRPGIYLVAVSGPEAGRWAPLPVGGDLTVGRAADSPFQLNDTLVSSRHLRVGADHDGVVTIEDLGSSNGSFLEGRPLTGPTAIAPGEYAQVGATVLTIVDVRPSDLHALAAPKAGAAPFQRQFRPALQPLPQELVPPEEPKRAEEERGRMVLQLLIPLISGVGFAVISGRWYFLAIALLGPIIMVGYQLLKRRRETAKHRALVDAYETELATHQRNLALAHSTEQQRRRHAAVVGGEAVLMAQLAHQRLWEREPGDIDYLEVCIGLATLPSAVLTSRERDAAGAPLWGIPLGVSVRETGSLLVAGEQRRARAVGRSMLLSLATTHSPRDLQISVFTTEDRAEDWNWARWLPHAFAGPATSRLYTTPEQRDAVMSALVQRIETFDGPEPSNAHVVIFDGAHIVDGSRLTSVLRRGPGAGVYGVVLDERITPEGVRGTLRLGAQPDEGVFTSATLAETPGILTAELAPSWAEMAAVSMAGFQPASAEESGTTVAEVHLLDLLVDGRLDAAFVQDRWSSSPRESVPVGLAGRTQVQMDIVRHGPHAIAGGATRSGKTEFLLTWLTSMCLYNSPDDLAILVADFKGGVDHVQTAKLPHVISLSTNKDIRAFERTLILLESEIKRREDMFSTAGTSNIEAYRVARKRDGSLTPIPRLMVVVDEFSELRQTDREGGGGYMGRLESVARVGAGLGIHLVLVTQNFADGQLPAQVESQIGLGVCFRVEEGAHSKVVLRSPIAATIPADRPGRGWARLRGLELQEFQSARVAGRRRDLQADGANVHIEQVPFTAVSSSAPDQASGAVPHSDTDLVLFLDAMNDAARGYAKSIPWPAELDPGTTLAEVLARARLESLVGAAFGIADVPAKQEQRVAMLRPGDSQLLVVGSSGAQVGEALLTLAAAEALTTSPNDLHLYGIDLDANWLQALAALPHTAAVACLNDDLALRIVRRLSAEAERRRAIFDHLGVTDLDSYRRTSETPLPQIRLYVNGVDRVVPSSANEASVLSRPLSALIADAPGTGIDIVMAGGPAIVGRSITQRSTRRLVLALNDATLYRSFGVPAAAEVDLAVPLRAYDSIHHQVVQIGQLSSGAHRASEVVEGLGDELTASLSSAGTQGWPEPMLEVRWPLLSSRIDHDSLRVPQGYRISLPVGVDSESARWHWMDVEEDGPLLAIGGPGRSGRSTALLALAALGRDLGWAVQAVAPSRRSPLHGSTFAIHTRLADLVPATATPTLYLIDDVHRLEQDEDLKEIIDGCSRPFLIAMAGPDDVLGRKMGPLRGTPDLRASITLGSTNSTAIGGARIPEHLRIDPRAGRGVLWRAGELSGIHIPLYPTLD